MKFSLLFYSYVLSLFYIVFLIILFFSKKRLDNRETRIYKRLLITNFFGILVQLACEIFSIFTVKYVTFLVTKMLLVYFIIWLSFFFAYVLEISNVRRKGAKYIELLTIILMCIIVVVLPYNIYINPSESIYYTNGIDTKFTYFISILFTAAISLIIITRHKQISEKKAVPIYILVICFIFSGLIQYFLPYFTIIVQIECFICLVMYFTIENPDVKMIEQLEVAKDAADKANAAKTDFLSNMSHEIRTPLNAIVGFSDEIEQAHTLDEAKENAKDIINASNTLLEIVNGILDISKIEAGKLEIVNTDYNANELFTGLAKLVTPKMNEKALDFQVSIAEDLPKVLYGDPANLRKVVTNLLSNAYKYTDSGFVKYVVSCVNKDNICSLVISVEDSGRGMKPENVDKLFTKFQRLDEDRNTTIEGTGLGLALTKQLVELMGGKIVVHTVYGQGSKFTVMISQRIDNVEISQVTNVSDSLDLTNRRLLVVDDNPLNLKVATKLLQRYNAIVDCCDSGYACISKFDNGEKYDLVLLDDMMPKMSGVETLHKLKEKGGFNTPVIALTANAITGMREKYIQDGFTDYLAKPIEKTEMIKIFNNILGSTSPVTSSEYIKPVESNGISLDRSFLEANNIDVNHGLELLGDMDLYNDTMGEFIKEMDERLPKLKEYKENSDMPNYAILVHAIKSDCKYLGIMALADVCYEHELKSKASDVDFVNSNFDKLMDDINDYVIICKKYLGKE